MFSSHLRSVGVELRRGVAAQGDAARQSLSQKERRSQSDIGFGSVLNDAGTKKGPVWRPAPRVTINYRSAELSNCTASAQNPHRACAEREQQQNAGDHCRGLRNRGEVPLTLGSTSPGR